LVQKWSLKSGISLVDEGKVFVEELECVIVNMQGGIMCTVEENDDTALYRRGRIFLLLGCIVYQTIGRANIDQNWHMARL